MIYLTGDTHARVERLNLKNCPARAKDYVIILGDFGLVWNDSVEENKQLDWLSDKPYTTLIVDGNHENHFLLDRLPECQKLGNTVGKIRHNIFHLKRGNIYTIEGKKFLAFGGAISIDKADRREFYSWWKEEIPSHANFENAMINLEKHNFEVDYIIAHTCPKDIAMRYLQGLMSPGNKPWKLHDPTEDMLTEIVSKTKFKRFYCGHWHDNFVIENYTLLYENIIPLEI